jgi:hypothetical protein
LHRQGFSLLLVSQFAMVKIQVWQLVYLNSVRPLNKEPKIVFSCIPSFCACYFSLSAQKREAKAVSIHVPPDVVFSEKVVTS